MSAAMNPLRATIEGIGFWAPGLPTWEAASHYARSGELPADAPARPSPQLLAPNERRRAPETVAVALEVALAACQSAGREPAALPSVFASMHGDLAITDYMCATLATDPASVSPTRFHNSVHNAAAGYWTIGTGAMQPATALSAGSASFAQALIDALAQLHSGSEAVLLVAYDSQATGPLAAVSPSQGVLGAALVLSLAPREDAPVLELDSYADAAGASGPEGALSRRLGANAMAPMLPLFDALATQGTRVALHAGPGQQLRLRLAPARAVPAPDELSGVAPAC
jgi:hypothetical protein